MQYSEKLETSLNKLKLDGRYINFNQILTYTGMYSHSFWEKETNSLNMSNSFIQYLNDYLGISKEKLTIDTIVNSFQNMKTGCIGVKNIYGNSSEIDNILLSELRYHFQSINYSIVLVNTEKSSVTPRPLYTEKIMADLIIAFKYALNKNYYSKIA